MMTGHYKDNEY